MVKTTPRQKRTRARRFRQLSTASSYAAVLALIATIVSVGYQSPVEQQVASRGLSTTALAVTNPSVDQIVAADLAATTARVANLSVASNAANLSISLSAKSELAQSNDNLLTKPQIVQTSGEYRGITQYTTTTGETVTTVAAKFGISEQTLRWSNNLASDAFVPGTTLSVPGTDGVVYTVANGDTIDTIANKYGADKQLVITYNDLEVGGISSGQRIVLPGGILPETERPGYTAPAPAYTPPAPATRQTFATRSSVSVGNRYDYGYCTWYVYERRAELGRPIGGLWGNAVTWTSYAASEGYLVNSTPAVGAILQDPNIAPPWGHVAVVERINADGSIFVSEMNYVGWNVTSTRTIPAGQVGSYSYIH